MDGFEIANRIWFSDVDKEFGGDVEKWHEALAAAVAGRTRQDWMAAATWSEKQHAHFCPICRCKIVHPRRTADRKAFCDAYCPSISLSGTLPGEG